MAHSRSAEKRIRQNRARRLHNRSQFARIKGCIKQFQTALQGNDAEAVRKTLKECVSRLDKAAARHVIHKNSASRQKSRLMTLAQKRLAAATA
ncbi:MAG: 30S ribosomal protein S20 [Planctomycetota bacterium]